jgi:hypothetical protein
MASVAESEKDAPPSCCGPLVSTGVSLTVYQVVGIGHVFAVSLRECETLSCGGHPRAEPTAVTLAARARLGDQVNQ